MYGNVMSGYTGAAAVANKTLCKRPIEGAEVRRYINQLTITPAANQLSPACAGRPFCNPVGSIN